MAINNLDFASQIESWVAENSDLAEGVFRESVQRVVEIMQRGVTPQVSA